MEWMKDKRIRFGVAIGLVAIGTGIFLWGTDLGIIPMMAGLLVILCYNERPNAHDYLKSD